jgi:hypothetical protein
LEGLRLAGGGICGAQAIGRDFVELAVGAEPAVDSGSVARGFNDGSVDLCARAWNREGGGEMKAEDGLELWQFTLSVDCQGDGDNLDRARARWTPTGLDIPETTTLENIKEILRAFKAFETTGTLALADLLNYVTQRGWEREIEQ